MNLQDRLSGRASGESLRLDAFESPLEISDAFFPFIRPNRQRVPGECTFDSLAGGFLGRLAINLGHVPPDRFIEPELASQPE